MELPSAPVTENELEHFRREWKKQLDRTHPHGHQGNAQSTGAAATGLETASGLVAVPAGELVSTTEQPSLPHNNKPVKYTAKRPAPQPGATTHHPSATSHSHTQPLAPAAAPSSAKTASVSSSVTSPSNKQKAKNPAVPTLAPATPQPTLPATVVAGKHKNPTQRAKSPVPKAAVVPASSSSSSISSASPPAIECTASEVKAMELYEEAMELEVSGRLADALQAYRSAFKLDPDVDVRFRTQFKLQQSQRAAVSSTASANALGLNPRNDTNSPETIPFSTWLAQLKEAHSPLLPLHANRAQPISRLPEDLLLRVFQITFASDTHAFFATSLVCKQFLVLSREATVWRYVCAQHYPHRQQEIQGVPREDWMDFFRSEPRIRTDGAYISACRYIRPGFSESSMNAPILIVEYYRYLRFYRNGTVIAYMSPSEPRDIVKHLTPSASKLVHGEGYQSGRYLIQGDQVFLELHDRNRPLTTFNIQLAIRGSKRRVNRVARLEWTSYTLTTLTGRNLVPEEVELDLNEFKPFVFAKVKSYIK